MSADFGMASIKMLGSLIIVLGLIIGLFVLLTRLRVNSLSVSRFPNMRVIRNLNLGPKRSVALIEICDQWLLLGIGTESVNLIKEIPRPSGEESEILEQNGTRGFHSLLRGLYSLTDGKIRIKNGKDT